MAFFSSTTNDPITGPFAVRLFLGNGFGVAVALWMVEGDLRCKSDFGVDTFLGGGRSSSVVSPSAVLRLADGTDSKASRHTIVAAEASFRGIASVRLAFIDIMPSEKIRAGFFFAKVPARTISIAS